MGSWGVSTFENDEALDWTAALLKSSDLSIVMETLARVGEDADADVACTGLAAAEVIAALVGLPAEDLPTEVSAWVAKMPSPPKSATHEAHQAVERILTRSELLTLWEESGELERWQADVRDLLARLA